MLYSVLAASLIALAAATIDRLFAIWRLPRRYLWSSAMMIAALAPFVAAARNAPSRLAPPPLEQPPVRTVSVPGSAVWVAPLQIPLTVRAMRVLRPADRIARILWAATSTFVFLAFLRAFFMLRVRRASWTTATVDGHTTWIARDVGPAVVGLIRPQIVLPHWALQLGDTDRAFVLRHESEHIRAGDPRLLLVAGLLLVAMPWNPALWWMTRRMRLAMEIDCDARVLRGTDAMHEYGMMLLAVDERRGRTLPLAASLTEQRALLERRILAMTASRPSYPRLVSAALGLVACAAAIAVAQTPIPQGGAGRAAGVSDSATTHREIVEQTRELIEKLVTDYYPQVMQGTSPLNRITFVLDADGNYVTSASWTDAAMLRRSAAATAVEGAPFALTVQASRTFESVRAVMGAGVAGGGGRSAPAAGTRGGASVRDFGAYGFPNITSDAVLLTTSASSLVPNPLSVFVIRLKK